jgi:hypothetical protein
MSVPYRVKIGRQQLLSTLGEQRHGEKTALTAQLLGKSASTSIASDGGNRFRDIRCSGWAGGSSFDIIRVEEPSEERRDGSD